MVAGIPGLIIGFSWGCVMADGNSFVNPYSASIPKPPPDPGTDVHPISSGGFTHQRSIDNQVLKDFDAPLEEHKYLTPRYHQEQLDQIFTPEGQAQRHAARGLYSNIEGAKTAPSLEPVSHHTVFDHKGIPQAVGVFKHHPDHVEVKFVATAPWNLMNQHPNKTKGAGAAMMEVAIRESMARGHGGRVRLDGLSNAAPFYKHIGMQEAGRGRDGDLWEYSPEGSQAFLNKRTALTKSADNWRRWLVVLEDRAGGVLAKSTERKERMQVYTLAGIPYVWRGDALVKAVGMPKPPGMAKPVQPTTPDPKQGYIDHALKNLGRSSRTAAGVIDTSASKGKADQMAVSGGDEAAKLAVHNYRQTMSDLHDQRDRKFTSPQDVLDFSDNVNRSVNRGIVKDGVLLRNEDSPKYPYTPVAHLETARQQFGQEFMDRLDRDDPKDTAAWVHWRQNFTDHPYADGVGKTSDALANFVLMRHGHGLHDHPEDRKEWFSQASKTVRDPNQPQSYYDNTYENFRNYYRSRFPQQQPMAKSAQYVTLNGIPYYWEGDRLIKAFVPAKHGVDFKHFGRPGSREVMEPKPQNPDASTPWKGPKAIGELAGPSNLDPQWSGKNYTPDTGAKYFANSGPDWGKHDLDPTQPTVNPDHVKARQATHDAIAQHFVGKTPSPKEGEKKRAIFMVGGPAAGKSSMLKQRFSEDEMAQHVVINPDEIKNMLPEYRRGVKQRFWPAANNVHEESSYLSKRIFDEAAGSGKHLLVDGTGGNPRKYENQMDRLRSMGYEIQMMHMDKPAEQGVADAMGRAGRSGRYVPESVIQHTYNAIPGSVERLKPRADYWASYKAPATYKEQPKMSADGGPLRPRYTPR